MNPYVLALERDDILRLRKRTAEMVEHFEHQLTLSDVRLREHHAAMAVSFGAILLRYDEMLAVIEDRIAHAKETP